MSDSRLFAALQGARRLVNLPSVRLPSVGSKEEQKCFDKTGLESKSSQAPTYTKPDASGRSSHAFYHRLDFPEAEEKVDNFVYLTLNSIKGNREEISQRLINAHNLILNNRVPDDFHESYVYINSHGDRLAFKKIQLDTCINPSTQKLSPEEVKNLITDAVSAVYDFHRKGLIHGDIRSKHCLLTYRDGKYSLKLAGHGSTFLAARESQKEIDLYALGKLICNKLSLLATEEDHARIIDAFGYLCGANIAEPSSHSGTINHVIDNPYFGGTKQGRADHFNKRRAYVRTLRQKINGEHVTRRPVDDLFLLLASPAQNIYAAGKSLAEAMQEQPRTLAQIAVLMSKMETLDRTCSLAMHSKFSLFVNAVKDAAHEDFANNFPPVNFLQVAVSNAFNEFKARHTTQLFKRRIIWRTCSTIVEKTPELFSAEQLMLSIERLQRDSVAAAKEVRTYLNEGIDSSIKSSFRTILINNLSRLPEKTLDELKLNMSEIPIDYELNQRAKGPSVS